eukprot:757521-Amphidinium_carterae.1
MFFQHLLASDLDECSELKVVMGPGSNDDLGRDNEVGVSRKLNSYLNQCSALSRYGHKYVQTLTSTTYIASLVHDFTCRAALASMTSPHLQPCHSSSTIAVPQQNHQKS